MKKLLALVIVGLMSVSAFAQSSTASLTWVSPEGTRYIGVDDEIIYGLNSVSTTATLTTDLFYTPPGPSSRTVGRWKIKRKKIGTRPSSSQRTAALSSVNSLTIDINGYQFPVSLTSSQCYEHSPEHDEVNRFALQWEGRLYNVRLTVNYAGAVLSNNGQYNRQFAYVNYVLIFENGHNQPEDELRWGYDDYIDGSWDSATNRVSTDYVGRMQILDAQNNRTGQYTDVDLNFTGIIPNTNCLQ